MRIACVLVPVLPVQAALSGGTGWRTELVVIGGQPFEGKPVYDASPAAAACGVKAGMPLHEAYALCPEARFLAIDDERYQQLSDQIADILDGFSPTVEIAETGCAYLEIGGLGDELSLARQIAESISGDTGLEVRLGVSNSKFIARLAALTSTHEFPTVVAEGQEREFVSPFSIDVLPCPVEMKRRLRLLGIRHVWQLGEFSKISLIEQFGREGAAVWELAQGHDGASLIPRKKPDVIIASAEVDPPADTSLEILHHCQMALEKPLARMRRQGKVCSELVVEIRFASGTRQENRLPFKKGTVSASVMLDRVRAWLEGVQFPQPVTDLHLLIRLGAETGERLRLWREHAGPRPELASLAKYLATKLGFQPLKRFEMADAGAVFPERRFKLVNLPEEEAKDG